MNEETKQILNEKLIETLSWIERTAKSGESLLVEQTPLYIQELLAWNFWLSLIWFCVGIPFLFIGLHALRTVLKVEWRGPNQEEEKQFYGVFGSLFGFFLAGVFMLHNFEWLQIKLAPRVWLVEYLQEMIK